MRVRLELIDSLYNLRSIDNFLNKTPLRILSGKTHSNKTQLLTKSMNMDIWVIGIQSQLTIRGFHSQF